MFFSPEKRMSLGKGRAGGFWSSGCCGRGRAGPDGCASLVSVPPGGAAGLPFLLPRPSAGAGGQQGSVAVPVVYMVQFHLSQWLPGPALLVPSSRAERWMMRFTSNKILGGGSLQERISQALAPRSELRPPGQVPADAEDRFPVRSPTCHEPSFSSRQLPPSLSQRGYLSL